MILTARITGLEQVRRNLRLIGQQSARRALAATAEEVEDYVHQQVAKHTKGGALFRSVQKKHIGEAWEIGHDLQHAPHALFVHWGTGLWGPKKAKFKIAPKLGGGKKSLRFPITGFVGPLNPGARGAKGRSGFAFAKYVMHPGNKPDPWMIRAAALAPAIFERHVAAALANLSTK